MRALATVSGLVMVLGLVLASGLVPLSITTGQHGGGVNGVALIVGTVPFNGVLYFSGGACAVATDGGAGCVSGLTVYLWVLGPTGALEGKTSVVTSAGGSFNSSVDFNGAEPGTYELFGSLCPAQQACADPIGTASFGIEQATRTIGGTVTTMPIETGTLSVSCVGSININGKSYPCSYLNPDQKYNLGGSNPSSGNTSFLGIGLFLLGAVGVYEGSKSKAVKKAGSE